MNWCSCYSYAHKSQFLWRSAHASSSICSRLPCNHSRSEIHKSLDKLRLNFRLDGSRKYLTTIFFSFSLFFLNLSTFFHQSEPNAISGRDKTASYGFIAQLNKRTWNGTLISAFCFIQQLVSGSCLLMTRNEGANSSRCYHEDAASQCCLNLFDQWKKKIVMWLVFLYHLISWRCLVLLLHCFVIR